MAHLDIDKVTEQLAKTIIEPDGVSFLGKSLKLDTEEDAKEIIEALNNCKNLEYFNLEGNTLGVNAARAIAKCLEQHGELKRALWKDMFTGRMKTEIPKALDFLGSGLILGGAQLTELDLSDNAFGPIGVNGLAQLLKSPACYSLQVFKLNNNGLGINGGKILSQALIECYQKSKEQGTPLALKVFIAGRNRLENEGAQNLAKFFEKIGTLEELMMPQNGIYHVGVKAICDALKVNTKLKVLNLNDNTLTVKGASSLSQILPLLKEMKILNIGDCILKTKGAVLIAEALKDHTLLEELHLESNEIKLPGGIAIVNSLANKKFLKCLNLVGNSFGEAGRNQIREILERNKLLECLESMSEDEDEGEDESEQEEEEEEEDEDEEGEIEEEDQESENEKEINTKADLLETSITNDKSMSDSYILKENQSNENDLSITFQHFIESPSRENFLKLGKQRNEIILKELKNYNQQGHLNDSIALIMKVSSFSILKDKSICTETKECCLSLYQELLNWAKSDEQRWTITNLLLIYLGLLKGEDKNFKITWNVEGCFIILKEASLQKFFPISIIDTVKFFIKRQVIKIRNMEILVN